MKAPLSPDLAGYKQKGEDMKLETAKDEEVRLVKETINFGDGPEEVLCYYPKSKRITCKQQLQAVAKYMRIELISPERKQEA